ncbi:hypothetical protein SLNWT_1941 [Streptomyces albus]|uniref:Uncharacterized protein n=1 Tax=Streptomyces albus (strain ATCC 21838 / DSM 41398 / FERM P-419 / JCM 4703 / NBRC 107858) TaxID=1081613 RepID=A0A0B5EW60_STRA4|nr:hypothetical protein SLNWT_1941 [Streptomyces albus]AOU76634.1 hypothetical protein SLNHY_1943 [Streptomyces albus]AYN32417.1 hypothetical protein DUI70_1914 [Streptomyces albus]
MLFGPCRGGGPAEAAEETTGDGDSLSRATDFWKSRGSVTPFRSVLGTS